MVGITCAAPNYVAQEQIVFRNSSQKYEPGTHNLAGHRGPGCGAGTDLRIGRGKYCPRAIAQAGVVGACAPGQRLHGGTRRCAARGRQLHHLRQVVEPVVIDVPLSYAPPIAPFALVGCTAPLRYSVTRKPLLCDVHVCPESVVLTKPPSFTSLYVIGNVLTSGSTKAVGRASKEISLEEIATEVLEAVALFRHLDALGDHLDRELVHSFVMHSMIDCLTVEPCTPWTSDVSSLTNSGSSSAKLVRPAYPAPRSSTAIRNPR